jgi:hypothetical protein
VQKYDFILKKNIVNFKNTIFVVNIENPTLLVKKMNIFEHEKINV